ncbi:MAG: formate/nitrite transporter family protein [Verrucomicrobiota bacterium]|nr:formate/nitrite transporter family protein [Verrucomicrobiota bacterium]
MSEPEDVQAEAEEKSAPSAYVVYEAIRSEGEHELERKTSSLAWSGLAAGLSMGFSLLSQALLRHHLPQSDWQPLIAKLGYAVGFLIVILGRQQLFTENTLTVILPLLVGQTTRLFGNVVRLWSVVFLANVAGAFIFALVMAKTAAVDPAVREMVDRVADEALSQPFGTTLLRAIFAGWLIALMVWLIPAAEAARFWVIVVITYLIGLGHFPHVVAGSVEAFYLAINGMRTWWQVLGGFLLPTLIGNIIGGVTLVAALAHAQIVGDKEKDAEQHG